MIGSTALRILALTMACLLAACSGGRGSGGGYYLDDGPPSNPPGNLDSIPDATPRIEPLASGPNRPYTVMGKRYVPDTTDRPYRKRGTASWYGRKFHGNPTSNGERYDMYAMTAAHTTLPIPSYVRVTRISNGRSVIVRVNDRGPFLHGREIDLSYAAAHRLGMLGPGSTEVLVERITPDEIRSGAWRQQSQTAVARDNLFMDSAEPPAPRMATMAQPVSMTASQIPADQGVYLQLGAFRDESNARALASRAVSNMPSQMPVAVDQASNQIYRVRVGPFASREAAMQAITPIYQSIGVMPSISLR